MSIVLDGKAASAEFKNRLKEEISGLKRSPALAIIHFNDSSSLSYLKGRIKIAQEIGVEIKEYAIDESMSEEQLINLVKELNSNALIDGIMVDRPLPKKYNEQKIISNISSIKDVDGYTCNNLGNLVSNIECNYCCTPGAAIRLLEFYNIDLTGKNALVIGRSVNVGKPLALMLLNKNATVTIAHSKTRDLFLKTKEADIIFLAIGKANFLHLKDVNENAIIVDIGINYDENGKLCGDASKDIYDNVYAYSRVPGGVGVLTNVVLMENLLKAYRRNNNA